MLALPLHLTIKDGLIAVTLVILAISFLQIRRLKKLIAHEARRQLTPQLTLSLVIEKNLKDTGLFLTNESFFLARNIKIEDLELTIDDFGYKVTYILQFGALDFLKEHDTAKIDVKVLDKNREFLSQVTESIIPHLIGPSFKLKVCYTNVENLQFCVLFSKKREKFIVEGVELLPSNKPAVK
jgi:hypothetical protein